MKKRLISLALSAVTAISAVSAVSALNTNALVGWGTLVEEEIEEHFKEYVKLDAKEYECFNLSKSEYPNLYMRTYDLKSKIAIYVFLKTDDSIWIEVGKDIDTSEIEKKIKALDEGFKVVKTYATSDTSYIKVLSEEFPIETVKEICEIVGDKAIKTDYNFNSYSYEPIEFDYITGYDNKRVVDIIEKDRYTEVIHESNEEIFTEYAEKHSDEVELKYFSSSGEDHRGFSLWKETYYLIPKKELTTMEHLELAMDIYEETGLTPFGYSLEMEGGAFSSKVDLTNYLNGDANCDNIQSMADAAAILQAIGNPDKYALSDLGEFNADYACDGLTADDAIAIQKKLAGITE
ncbi:MAG: hypothetical protein J6A57_04995 [Ruminococcus sp.]|nr:hypothetical protein [Ruminococcus sp.]